MSLVSALINFFFCQPKRDMHDAAGASTVVCAWHIQNFKLICGSMLFCSAYLIYFILLYYTYKILINTYTVESNMLGWSLSISKYYNERQGMCLLCLLHFTRHVSEASIRYFNANHYTDCKVRYWTIIFNRNSFWNWQFCCSRKFVF